MSGKRGLAVCTIAVLCVLALLASSCGNRLLIKGLTLPSGSVEKEFSEDKSSMNPLIKTGSIMGGGGEVRKAVMVSFDNPKGWDAVAADIDGKLKAQGFGDAMGALGQLMQSAGAMRGAGAAGGKYDFSKFDPGKWMHMYNKEGSRYKAMLTNNDLSAMTGAFGGGGAAGMLKGIAPGAPGQFTLYVVQYKGDD